MAVLGACAEADPPGTTAALRIDPTADVEIVQIGVPTGLTVRAFWRASPSSPELDVTSAATWSSDDPMIATSSGGGVPTLQGVGGRTQIHAMWQGAEASADLSVMASGSVYLDGTDASAEQRFDDAMPDPQPANAPAPEYPLDGVVLPGNLPPIEFQWSLAADNDLYRIHFTGPNLDVFLYTTALELQAPGQLWSAIGASGRDEPTAWTIEATGPTQLLRTSPARTLTVSADTIDNSAIYVWQNSTGTFRVLDIGKGTDTVLPTTSDALQGTCVGCHRISRDGKRFAYTTIDSFQFGTLAFDPVASSFQGAIAPSAAYAGTYAAFNPNEAAQRPALLVSRPDSFVTYTDGTVRLELRDPDTNAVLPSNVDTMIGQLGTPAPGQATTMPDWAPDGSFVVFSAYDSDLHHVRYQGDDVTLASIVEAPVAYAGGTFTFGTPRVLVAASPNADPATGQNNFLPAISPDGSAVAFTRATGSWPTITSSVINVSGQIAIVRRSDGQVIELQRGSNPAGTTRSSTWPQWAPSMGQRYAWLAYSSERPYGHRVTPDNASCGMILNQQSCKQLWVMAIDVAKLHQGTDDPSAAAFWIPGQSLNAQYVSPQWTQAAIILR